MGSFFWICKTKAKSKCHNSSYSRGRKVIYLVFLFLFRLSLLVTSILADVNTCPLQCDIYMATDWQRWMVLKRCSFSWAFWKDEESGFGVPIMRTSLLVRVREEGNHQWTSSLPFCFASLMFFGGAVYLHSWIWLLQRQSKKGLFFFLWLSMKVMMEWGKRKLFHGIFSAFSCFARSFQIQHSD